MRSACDEQPGNCIGTGWAILFILSAGLLSRGVHAATLTTLFCFEGTNGSYPYAALVAGPGGSLYGTSSYGGVGFDGTYKSGNGVVFKISKDGSYELLHAFSGLPDGRGALSRLIQGGDQNFYGTTYEGGTPGAGSVYGMTASGELTMVSFFPYSGNVGNGPCAPLLAGADGSFYGTTFYGGSFGIGTVFRMDTNGVLSTLVTFPNAVDHSTSPYGGLVWGPDGLLYGTTAGAVGDWGSVFKLSTDGSLSNLFVFQATNGANPQAELTWGADGRLYGTTSGAWEGGNGTVFRVTTNGNLETLVFFGYTNGANPTSALIVGSDGDFYGTTEHGGDYGNGTVFRMRPDGAWTTIFHFDGTNGASPHAGLLQGDDGYLYGTTTFGGPTNLGTIFRLDIRPSIQSLFTTDNRVRVLWKADVGNSYQVQWATNFNQVKWNNLGASVRATNAIMSATDLLDPGGVRFYRLLLLP